MFDVVQIRHLILQIPDLGGNIGELCGNGQVGIIALRRKILILASGKVQVVRHQR